MERLGAFHKRRPHSKERICPVRTSFGQTGGGDFQMRTSTLFGAKKLQVFWNFCCVHTDNGRGVRAIADVLRTRGRGSIFAILCGRLLWTAPLHNLGVRKHSGGRFVQKLACC